MYIIPSVPMTVFNVQYVSYQILISLYIIVTEYTVSWFSDKTYDSTGNSTTCKHWPSEDLNPSIIIFTIKVIIIIVTFFLSQLRVCSGTFCNMRSTKYWTGYSSFVTATVSTGAWCITGTWTLDKFLTVWRYYISIMVVLLELDFYKVHLYKSHIVVGQDVGDQGPEHSSISLPGGGPVSDSLECRIRRW